MYEFAHNVQELIEKFLNDEITPSQLTKFIVLELAFVKRHKLDA